MKKDRLWSGDLQWMNTLKPTSHLQHAKNCRVQGGNLYGFHSEAKKNIYTHINVCILYWCVYIYLRLWIPWRCNHYLIQYAEKTIGFNKKLLPVRKETLQLDVWKKLIDTVDRRNPKQPPGMVLKHCKDYGIFTISTGKLDFWTINSICFSHLGSLTQLVYLKFIHSRVQLFCLKLQRILPFLAAGFPSIFLPRNFLLQPCYGPLRVDLRRIWLGVAGYQDQANPTDGIIEMGYNPQKKHVLTLLLDIQF